MQDQTGDVPHHHSLRDRLRIVIFGVHTIGGRAFDVVLLIAILLSVLVVMLDSVAGVHARWGDSLWTAELVFTGLFTVEYILRLWTARHPLRYARSFYGVIDLLAILPTYLSVLIPGAQSLLVIRALRMLRVFRVLKLVQFIGEAGFLLAAMRASLKKIIVFLSAVVILVTIIGSIMHLVEGAENGFTSIPRSVYWAIVTLTTVGYGDIAPQTVPGQFLASCVMILGYSIIAVPTGIVTAEITTASARAEALREERLARERAAQAADAQAPDDAGAMPISATGAPSPPSGPRAPRTCPACAESRHLESARYCAMCGTRLSQGNG